MENTRFSPLTARKLELLTLYYEPLHGKAMAKRLGITRHTFYTHQRNIIRKLNLPTIAHAVCMAVRRGWI